MSKIAVQIYEIQDPFEAEAVVSLGVDRIGSVIVSQKNWKNEHVKDAVRVTKEKKAKHSIIPLFNDEDAVFRTIEFYEPDIVHFCESLVLRNGYLMDFEPLVRLQRKVKKHFPNLEIMRSIPIVSANDRYLVSSLEIAQHFEKWSDTFLTDTWLGKEPVEGFVGITGKTCNWGIARRLVESTMIPVIVAGGLSPENVYDAIVATRPKGVDSCTKTNRHDKKGDPIRFKKDLSKVRKFVKETRRAKRYVDKLMAETARQDMPVSPG